MKNLIIAILTIAILTAMLAGCTQTPAPVQGAPDIASPPQGITVNQIDFIPVDVQSLSAAQQAKIETLKVNKGYSYWEEDGGYMIAIFAGEQPTAGYQLHVKSIEDNEGKTNILVDLTAPQGMVNQVITYPYIVVKAAGITDNFNIEGTDGSLYPSL